MKDMLDARDSYISLIRKELLGPGSEISIPDDEHELISTSPDVRYSIGILFPRNNKLNADNNDSSQAQEGTDDKEEAIEKEDEESEDAAVGTGERSEQVASIEEDNLDEEISLATQNMPSSMGITFFAKGAADRINCKVKFATYRKVLAYDCKLPFSPKNADDYAVPDCVAEWIFFDKESASLCLKKGGLSRKIVTQIKERDLIESDEADIIYDSMYKLSGQLRNGFIREPHESIVTIDFGDDNYVDANRELDGTAAKLTALRRKISDSVYSINIMLVNDSDMKANGERCIFQPVITVSTKDNKFCFQEYAGITDFSILDKEEQSLELQYRNKKMFGTGLGTSANWQIDENGYGILYSDFFPQIEVPGMDFLLDSSSRVEANAMSMKFLSDLCKSDKGEKIGCLKSIVSAYRVWIDRQKEKISEIDSKYEGKYHDIAGINMAGCEKALSRMEEGIQELCDNENAWNAFQLANRAMFMQRVHLKLQEQTSNKDRFPDDEELSELLDALDYNTADRVFKDNYAWRPFQIAFLLMSVVSICREESKDRELVDLIWFPTGGGKTEAYLGLTAYTIFYRRLAHAAESGGSTVIMRYTLRLLAAQQFTRASTLICACEFIRRDSISKKSKYGKYPLGDEAITIGLWIGGEHTPNKNDTAKKELEELRKATAFNIRDVKDKHNKFQVLKCPWCGTKLVKERVENRLIGDFAYRMRNNSHFEIYCPQESCYFNEVGTLPVQIVDEELYASPPTLLFGTVDKFAMLPWNKAIGAFFASGSNNRPPELIIQDELHLISGPLGTMVGLYETVIDALCEEKGVKAKIVASTATIRRAREQCAALYNRDVAQFPPPGLDAEDSFFARESIIDYENDKFGRKYIGLMPSGKTKAVMETRAIAALMQKIKTMNLTDEVKDKYWTLTVYFNSLKELGMCITLVDDVVKEFIRRMAYRLGTARDVRLFARADELTSRISTTELNETLDKLEKMEYSESKIKEKQYPSDVLLATNMISVGIDVARLNVMLIVGQPKLTNEYIQASSRIGRHYPGIAFTMYDGSKSRDRSHYEQFKSYHESFYKYVEPTSATPFSKPARDRALHAVVIALLRHMEMDLSSEKSAANFKRVDFAARINRVKEVLVSRNCGIVRRLNSKIEDDSERIREEIDTLLERWERMAEDFDEEHFCYGEKYMVKHPEEGYGRLMKAFNTSPYDKAFDTMTSMRNVDSAVIGNVLIWEE